MGSRNSLLLATGSPSVAAEWILWVSEFLLSKSGACDVWSVFDVMIMRICDINVMFKRE